MKRFLILLLACLMCMPAMVACNKTGEDGDQTPPPSEEYSLPIVANDLSDYQIVISKDDYDYIEDLAYDLRLVIRSITGVSIPIVYDTAAVKDTEIVFGNTNRKSLYTLPVDYKDGYIVCVCEQRLIFEARSSSMMKTAAATFVRNFFNVSIDSTNLDRVADIDDFSVPSTYQIYNDTAALYQVIYDGTYMQKRYAYMFHDQIKSASGLSSTVLIETKQNGVAPQITFEENTTLERGYWRIEVSADQRSILVQARDYYGFNAAAKYVAKMIKEAGQGAYPFEASTILSGSHIELLTKAEASTAYAYNRTADHRVMFYNVLWGNPEVQERNGLAVEMIAQYMPDVIGMQEMNNTKRTGKNAIPTLLAQYGYVESIDPRVENMKSEADGGWGTSNGTKVTIDDKTYYTYMNCTPLFYNQNTTELIYSEYYWYKNQIDKSNEGNCGVTDCASKSLTWGVFESKATGERYIVISTHMCTRSNGVRGEQAKEAVELINKIIAPVDEGGYGYNYPIFFGGDFNGQARVGNNYKHFVNVAGYVDVRDSELPTIHNSPAQTMHSAPVYDDVKGMLVSANYENAGASGGSDGSVDHIFLANEGSQTVDITVFGVVVDECSRMGSDHLPIFVDFSLS